MTSHDVVGRCRRIFGTRKVGHAGTLDPMATGVLVVGVERATKILGLLTATDKSYAATIRLGQTTTTEDAEGEVLQTVSADARDRRRHRGRGGRAARRHRADAVGGQRDQGRRQARLPARPRGARPSSWRPARCASTGSRCCDVRRSDDAGRRRRRGRLLVGHLHPCAGPRCRRRPWRRRAPDRAAAHPRRPVRARRGAHARRPGRGAAAEPTPSTRRACWRFRAAT